MEDSHLSLTKLIPYASLSAMFCTQNKYVYIYIFRKYVKLTSPQWHRCLFFQRAMGPGGFLAVENQAL